MDVKCYVYTQLSGGEYKNIFTLARAILRPTKAEITKHNHATELRKCKKMYATNASAATMATTVKVRIGVKYVYNQ